MAKNLAELQSQMQSDILKRTHGTLPRISVPENTTAEKRFGVYQFAYLSRLIEILSGDYENTWKFVGDEQFYQLAVQYVEAYPSNHPNVRWFGRHFPKFLSEHESAGAHPVLAEIAAIEKAIEDAFDASNDDVATMDDLAAIPPELVTGLTFKLHSSCCLLKQQTNALAIYMALVEDETPEQPENLDEPLYTLAWRNNMMCQYRPLNAEEGMLIDLMQQGQSFATLCEMAATMQDADTAAARVAGHITGWLQSEIISELVIAK